MRISRLAEFLQEVRVEAKKVNWPTRRETTINTVLVVVFSLVVAAVLGIFDIILVRLLEVFVV